MNKVTGMLAAMFLLCFPLIVRLSSAGLLDIQITFIFCLSIFLFLVLLNKQSWGLSILLGITIGAGLLSKYAMFLIFPVLFALALVNKNLKGKIAYLTVSALIAGCIFFFWMVKANQYGIKTPGSPVLSFIQSQVNRNDFNGGVSSENSLPSEENSPSTQSNGLKIKAGWFLVTARGWKLLANIFLTQLPSAIGPYNFPVLLLGTMLLIRRRSAEDWMIMILILVFSAILLLTLPDHRYFMPLFPALAIIMGDWMRSHSRYGERVVILTLLYWLGSLYLFVDWSRIGPLFSS